MTTTRRPAEAGQTLFYVAAEAYGHALNRMKPPHERWEAVVDAVLAADPVRQAVTELLARWDTWLDHLPEDALIWGPLAVAADELRAALDGGGVTEEGEG